MKTLLRFLFKIVRIAAVIYGLLFAVFYWDLDGKFMYYILEPLMVKRFDNMKREDVLKTPYDMKPPIRPE